MHRRIAGIIEEIIVKSAWSDKVQIFIQRKDVDGYWKNLDAEGVE